MKKILVYTLSFFLMFTTVSFAVSNEIIDNTIKDLNMVRNDTDVILKKIITDTSTSFDVNKAEEIKKQVAFDRTLINSVLTTVAREYNKTDDLSIQRIYNGITTAASIYGASLNAILLQIENPKDINHLFYAISEYTEGSRALNEIISIVGN